MSMSDDGPRARGYMVEARRSSASLRRCFLRAWISLRSRIWQTVEQGSRNSLMSCPTHDIQGVLIKGGKLFIVRKGTDEQLDQDLQAYDALAKNLLAVLKGLTSR